jgi:uncharacterized membrane protein YhhN
VRTLWGAAVAVGVAYGVFLLVTALRSPAGSALTGQFALQPAVKALAAVLLATAIGVCVACVALLMWFWPRLIAEGMAIPVVLYMVVLAAMVCTALLAGLPTPWTALGALCFAVSDAMIGIGKFVLQAGTGQPATSGSEALAVPIWWAYATSLPLITAGLLFGRGRSASEHSATPPA